MATSRTRRRRRRDRRALAVGGVVLCVGAVIGLTTALADRGRRDGPPRVAPADPSVVADLPTGSAVPGRVIDEPVVPVRTLGNGMVSARLGCAEDRSAAALDRFLAERLGPSLGVDNPHVYTVGRDHHVWLLHDAFLDYTGDSTTLREAVYLQNIAMRQRGRCFEMLHGGTLAAPRPFEVGPGVARQGRFYWPLGGEIGSDGNLYVFWSEMQEDPKPRAIDGIKRHPVGTWIGVYDPVTLTKLAFARSPNPDVTPQYGSAVQTDGDYTYLFGNTNMLNLTEEGGYGEGPFSGTREYLARVPAGELTEEPEYYDAEGWSSDADDAAPISERFYTSNAMQPRVIDGRWYSVVKEDEFWGDRLLVETAEQPWGPWETLHDVDVRARFPEGVDEDVSFVTYQPILAPYRDPDGSIIVILSQNAGIWNDAVMDPRRYRPQALPFSVA